MKQFNFFSLLILLGLTACKGTQGDVGPAGTNGTDGNANVVYTDWKTPTWDLDYGLYNSAYYFGQNSTTSTVLTQDAIDKAAIFIYFKGKDLVRNGLGTYQLVDRIATDQIISYIKIPGRTTNLPQDYATMTSGKYTIGVNYLEMLASVDGSSSDADGNTYTISEFTNKTLSYYFSLAGSAIQYRIVVVYGSTKSARYAGVNWKDYTEVKEALKLKD